MSEPAFDILKCYEVLDVRPGATVETVRRAYLELAHVWDPGQHVGNPPLMHVAEQKRKEIDAAYQHLQSFLPDLKHVSDVSPIPVRPPDAITDQRLPTASPEVSAVLYIVMIGLLVSTLTAAGVFLWRIAHHKLPTATEAARDQP